MQLFFIEITIYINIWNTLNQINNYIWINVIVNGY